MIITPLEFYCWLIGVAIVCPVVFFTAGLCWHRGREGRKFVEELADLDTYMHGDLYADELIASLRLDGPPVPGLATLLPFPERGQLAAAEARALHPAQPRALATGADSTSSRLLALIVGGLALRDSLPGRAAAAVAASRRLLETEADQ